MRHATTNPIVVIGMHRSGTSALARYLTQLGVHMGWRVESHHESRFHLRLNEWMLRAAGGAWDQPEPFSALSQIQLQDLASRIDRRLASPRSREYVGPGYWRTPDPRLLPVPWGWKDPRTTITLPIWERSIGPARVIHVTRHGVDVAASLVRRQESLDRAMASRQGFRRSHPRAEWLLPLGAGGVGSTRCGTLDGAFELWAYYVDTAREVVAARSEDNAIELRFEDLLTDRRAADRLQTWLGLPRSEPTIDGLWNADRAFAFAESPQLRAFADKNSERLARRGY